MKPAMLLAAGLALAPAARSESVDVDVRVVCLEGREARVEFVARRSAWVAVYGEFSDGSLRAIFPDTMSGTHWVEANEVRSLEVHLPADATLESVQAVASTAWFDPAGLWIASGPSASRPGRVPGVPAAGTWT
jgi:hypothetical protein